MCRRCRRWKKTWGVRFEPRSVLVKTYVIEGAEKPSVDGT